MPRSVPSLDAYGEAMSISLSGSTFFPLLISERGREAIDKEEGNYMVMYFLSL